MSGTPLPLGRVIFAPQSCGTVFDLRSEPWKGPRLDSISREIRQKRAEAAAQRLAGLAGLGCSHGGRGGIRRWQAGTWHG